MGTIASKAIGLAFEGISSFLHHKRHKTLKKTVNVINSKSEIVHNWVYHLEDTMIMNGKYNSDTLMELVKTVHQMQNITTWKEKIFVSEMNEWLKHKLADIHNKFDYSIDAMLFLTTVKEKYVRMYEKFIAELKSYSKAIRILLKGYLPITLITPSTLEAILKQVQIAIAKMNQDYELVLYNILLPINCYIDNNTSKCHSSSMSDNRDLTETFHQKISSHHKVIASIMSNPCQYT